MVLAKIICTSARFFDHRFKNPFARHKLLHNVTHSVDSFQVGVDSFM